MPQLWCAPQLWQLLGTTQAAQALTEPAGGRFATNGLESLQSGCFQAAVSAVPGNVLCRGKQVPHEASRSFLPLCIIGFQSAAAPACCCAAPELRSRDLR